MGLMEKAHTIVTFFPLHWPQFGTFPLAKGGFCNERDQDITSCRSLMTDWTSVAFALDWNGEFTDFALSLTFSASLSVSVFFVEMLLSCADAS